MRAVWIPAFCLLLAACTGAPVQEMSDARQAVRAAQAAGAAEYAPEQLQSAITLIDAAQEDLRRQEYRSALRSAVEARRRAMEALEASRAARAVAKSAAEETT